MNSDSNSETNPPARCCFGCLGRRPMWWPTRRGWFISLLTILVLGWLGVRSIQPFLAVTDIRPGGLMVAEGWLPDYAMRAAVEGFQGGDFKGFYVTGVPLERGAPLSAYRTYAELGAAVVVRLGLPESEVTAVPGPDVLQDRTYASAIALRNWLEESGKIPDVLTVVSDGAHARRTRLLYQKAFGPEVKVGIMAVPDRDYDPKRWWASSAGVRDVIDESVAYLYARFVFRPPAGE